MSDQPVLVEAVELLDVVLGDEVLLPPAAGPDTSQRHLGISLRDRIKLQNWKLGITENI